MATEVKTVTFEDELIQPHKKVKYMNEPDYHQSDEDMSDDEASAKKQMVLINFQSESEENADYQKGIVVPRTTSKQILQKILTSLLNQEDEDIPYSFFIDEKEITKDIEELLGDDYNSEKELIIKYQAQAVFKVQAVTRCTSSLPGHAEAVLCTSFSPDGRYLASGSGDTTVRFWDVNTETPHFTARGHKHWVLVTAWSPDCLKLASGCKNGMVAIWDPNTGKQMGRSLTNHTKWITALCWEPLHLSSNGTSTRVASASKDGSIRIWNVNNGTCSLSLSGHTKSVTALRWSGQSGEGGKGYLYSASQDRTIKVWRASDGVLCRTLQGHGHWVNTLALNTDYVLRTGATEPQKLMQRSPEYAKENERKEKALERYNACLKLAGEERMVSGSDDFTLFLWTPETEKKPIARMTGHQQLVNDVKFSPDTRYIASASFDKSIRLWSGKDGKFIAAFRGHVSGVYQLAWSADSRLFVSGSKDSTLKVWSVAKKGILMDLPGHADEVYSVDWSPDGERVVSGGKDKILKLWRK